MKLNKPTLFLILAIQAHHSFRHRYRLYQESLGVEPRAHHYFIDTQALFERQPLYTFNLKPSDYQRVLDFKFTDEMRKAIEREGFEVLRNYEF